MTTGASWTVKEPEICFWGGPEDRAGPSRLWGPQRHKAPPVGRGEGGWEDGKPGATGQCREGTKVPGVSALGGFREGPPGAAALRVWRDGREHGPESSREQTTVPAPGTGRAGGRRAVGGSLGGGCACALTCAGRVGYSPTPPAQGPPRGPRAACADGGGGAQSLRPGRLLSQGLIGPLLDRVSPEVRPGVFSLGGTSELGALRPAVSPHSPVTAHSPWSRPGCLCLRPALLSSHGVRACGSAGAVGRVAPVCHGVVVVAREPVQLPCKCPCAHVHVCRALTHVRVCLHGEPPWAGRGDLSVPVTPL